MPPVRVGALSMQAVQRRLTSPSRLQVRPTAAEITYWTKRAPTRTETTTGAMTTRLKVLTGSAKSVRGLKTSVRNQAKNDRRMKRRLKVSRSKLLSSCSASRHPWSKVTYSATKLEQNSRMSI